LVFVLHHRKNEPAQTLLFVAGPWEESLRQLAAETRPRRVEPAR
jgi:hypothetical protein